MATVCAGSLALFDAGVPLQRAAAGAAIGLFSNEIINKEESGNSNYILLTDLLGLEDFFGDMDFKIAGIFSLKVFFVKIFYCMIFIGTSEGITAMQLDLKICGLTLNQMKETLDRGRSAINYVLEKMNISLNKPRSTFKASVPIIETWTLPSHYRRSILFKRGAYNVKLIESETGVQVNFFY